MSAVNEWEGFLPWRPTPEAPDTRAMEERIRLGLLQIAEQVKRQPFYPGQTEAVWLLTAMGKARAMTGELYMAASLMLSREDEAPPELAGGGPERAVITHGGPISPPGAIVPSDFRICSGCGAPWALPNNPLHAGSSWAGADSAQKTGSTPSS